MPEKLLSNLTMGSSYAVQVKAIANNSPIAEGAATLIMPPLGKPMTVALTVLSDKRITVNWQPVALCDGYKVAFSPTFTYGSLITGTTQTTSAMPNGMYSARVKAVVGDVEGDYTESGSVSVSDAIVTPAIGSVTATGIMSTTINLEGVLVSNGGDSACERGFVWSLSDNPTVSDSKVISAGTTIGTFYAIASGLTPNTSYFIRAYAKTSTGLVAYSNQSISVTTKTSSPSVTSPIISVSVISSITDKSATAYVTVASDGGGTITEIGGKVTKKGSVSSTAFSGIWTVSGSSFKVDMSSLSPESEYTFEGYAKNSQFTGTAEKVFFTVKQVVSILPPTNIYATDATGSTVNIDWTASVDSVDSYRVYYKPTIESITFTEMKGNSAWYKEVSGLSTSLDNLESDNWYQVRIVSVVDGVEGDFSDMISFKTAIGVSVPVVETVSVSNGAAFTLSATIKVTSDGGAELMEAGVVYTFAAASDPTYTTKLGNVFGTPFLGLGTKEAIVPELQAGTTYKVRAYAKNSAGMIGYGDTKTATVSESVTLPDVTLGAINSVSFLRDGHYVPEAYSYIDDANNIQNVVSIMTIPYVAENVILQVQLGKYASVTENPTDWYTIAELIPNRNHKSEFSATFGGTIMVVADPNTVLPDDARFVIWIDTSNPAWSSEVAKPSSTDVLLQLRMRYKNTVTGATGRWIDCDRYTDVSQRTVSGGKY